MSRHWGHPDADAPEFHLSEGPHPPTASVLPRLDREGLRRLEAALKGIEMSETKHERTFTEHRSDWGIRSFTARCSCGWVGTSASTKAKAGKWWHRHFEARTGRKAA